MDFRYFPPENKTLEAEYLFHARRPLPSPLVDHPAISGLLKCERFKTQNEENSKLIRTLQKERDSMEKKLQEKGSVVFFLYSAGILIFFDDHSEAGTWERMKGAVGRVLWKRSGLGSSLVWVNR